ncbi:MAG: AraC family transcriptional regulator, partial [Clostridiales bacterium]|nr:AraC family transcriptional regulator [Clostridiales bacterium]
YTARYVQKVFVEYIGISPKLFSRVIRFQKSLDYIFSNTSLDIYQMVYELGYYDHAHFIHEFKEFCLFSPSQIIHNKRDYSGILGLRNV